MFHPTRRAALLTALALLVTAGLGRAHGVHLPLPPVGRVNPGDKPPPGPAPPLMPTPTPGSGPPPPAETPPPSGHGPTATTPRPPAPPSDRRRPPRAATPDSGRGFGRPLHGTPSAVRWTLWWSFNRDRWLTPASVAETESSRPLATTRDPEGAFWREVAADALLEALGADDIAAATASAVALGRAQSEEASSRLAKLLAADGTDRRLREAAALGLGMIGDEEARLALTTVLASERAPTRLWSFAALGLGLGRSPETVPALVAIVRNRRTDREVRASALVVLGLPREPLVTPFLLDIVVNRRRQFDDVERAAAVHALGKLGDRSAIPVLLRAAHDDLPALRRAAVQALGRLSGPDDEVVERTLVAAVRDDRDALTRAYAAIALGRTGAPRGAAALARFLDDAHADVRGFAPLGLALLVLRREDDDLRDRVLRLLRTRLSRRLSTDLEGAVVTALGMLRDRESRPALRSILEGSGSPVLRGQTAVALGMIGDREALPLLRKLLVADRDPVLQHEVALALGLLRDSASVDALVGLVRDGSSEYVRGNAALGLGFIGSPRASRAMVELLADEKVSGPTRGMAAVALGYLLDRRPLPALFGIVEDLDWMLPVAAVRELFTIY